MSNRPIDIALETLVESLGGASCWLMLNGK